MLKIKPSQNFVPIKEIRDGVVILKDEGLRGIIMVSSVNLALKSEEEHNALILQFQNFLNSLDFSVEITVQSRELNIEIYIATLEKRSQEQKEELLKIQTREYIEFIRWFSDSVNIMTKSFYITVPYDGGVLMGSSANGLMGRLGGKSAKTNNERFEEKRSQLEQRISVVEQGLSSVGVRGVSLGTQELIELFYSVFNPDEPQKTIGINIDNQPKK